MVLVRDGQGLPASVADVLGVDVIVVDEDAVVVFVPLWGRSVRPFGWAARYDARHDLFVLLRTW